MLQKIVAKRFPSVEDFHVDNMAYNVKPVEYVDGRGRIAHEWPSVARWRVGSRRFAYVLKPKFRAERWSALCFGGTTVLADYSDEDEKMWKLLQWSAEGKTEVEINRLLGNWQPKSATLRNDGWLHKERA